MNYKYLVSIRCMTYNHAAYIEETMNGFCMQKTKFPFIAIIVDDASTDGEPNVIQKYLDTNFDIKNARKWESVDASFIETKHLTNNNCFFGVIFLKKNFHKQKHKKIAMMEKWENVVKYKATCEGDDYWIDPLKLQNQVGFLEENPDFTMVCNRTKLYSERRKKFIGENYCYNKSQIVNAKDVINRTGLFISTCSIIFRRIIINDIPDYWAKCKVGDYPLQIMCAMKGKIYYFNEPMSVYRVENSNSWMGQQKWGKLDKGRLEVIESQINMFKGFAKDFPQYKSIFERKIADHINRNIPGEKPLQEEFLSYFKEDIEKYNLIQKIDLWLICNLHSRKMKYYYLRIIHNQYFQRIKAF